MGKTFEEHFPEWLEDNIVMPEDHAGGDDSARDGPPSFNERWHTENEAFPEEMDSDGWPKVDIVDGDWNDSFKAPIVSISHAASSNSSDEEESSFQHNKAINMPRQLIVMRVQQQKRDTRDDREEPRGSNGATLTSSGTVLTLANAAAASIYASPALSITSSSTPSAAKAPSKQLYKKLPLLLCKSGRRRPKETGAFPMAAPRDSLIHFCPIDKPAAVSFTDQELKRSVPPRPSPRKVNRLCFDDFDISNPKPAASASRLSADTRSLPSRRHHKQVLPKNTLDLFCRDSGLVVTPETMRQQSILSSNQSEEDTVSSSSYEEDEDDSLTVSSLPNGVADSQVAKAFFLRDIQEEPEEEEENERLTKTPTTETSTQAEDFSTQLVRAASKSVSPSHPEDTILFKDSSPTKDPSRTQRRFSHLRPPGKKVLDRQKWLQEVFGGNSVVDKTGIPTSQQGAPTDQVDTTPVNGAIAKFGGRVPRKSRVQRRREELERKAAAIRDKEAAPSMKTRWEVCNGGYRKKIVLN